MLGIPYTYYIHDLFMRKYPFIMGRETTVKILWFIALEISYSQKKSNIVRYGIDIGMEKRINL